jgi:uncharacterized short protein YbdD (DUF466 family)
MTAVTAVTAVRRGLGALRWYVRGVLGADAYDKYLAHVTADHDGGTPMTEREFWHDRTDRLEANPQGRCC